MANAVVVGVGQQGQIAIANHAGATDVVVDIVGYYDGTELGARFTPTAPARVLDSRTSVGGWSGKLAAGTDRTLAIRGAGGVPDDATAVVANVTVTDATHGSFVTAWPTGGSQPTASSLNFAPGQTVANLVTLRLGDDGSLAFANEIGDVHVVVDVVGYYRSDVGARFHAVQPVRILDDRIGLGAVGPWGPGQTRSVEATTHPVPAHATAIVGNLTATNGTAPSYATVAPAGTAGPSTSTVNFGAGQTVPNLFAVGVDDGHLAVTNHAGNVDLIIDVFGWFADT